MSGMQRRKGANAERAVAAWLRDRRSTARALGACRMTHLRLVEPPPAPGDTSGPTPNGPDEIDIIIGPGLAALLAVLHAPDSLTREQAGDMFPKEEE